MIASQTTLIRTYGTDGEFGNDNGSKNGNKKLTKEQAADLKSKAGLEKVHIYWFLERDILLIKEVQKKDEEKCIMFTVLSIRKQKIVSHGFMM